MKAVFGFPLVAFAIIALWVARWDTAKDFLSEYGVVFGTAVIVIVALCSVIDRLYKALVAEVQKRTADHDREIERFTKVNERLAAENAYYRDRFFKIIDKMQYKEGSR